MAGIVLGATALSAQQQPPTFRAGTGTVPVWATVTDGAGGFALDLTRDDFEVKDNGKVQAITQFTTDAQPLSVVLLLDGSSSMATVFRTVMEGAASFVLRMLPADRTAIASFSDRFQWRQPFTSNRDELLNHLADEFNIRMGIETRLWEALLESVLVVGREPGRRVVVVLSDGKNWVAGGTGARRLGPPGPGPGRPQPTYAPSGASSVSPSSVLTSTIGRDTMVYAVAIWTREDNAQSAPSSAVMRVAEDTGGGFVELRESDDINAVFTEIARELHQQYVIGFTPQTLDGKTHKLEVRVRRPGMIVRARRSYVAEK
jgi:Ca-activated chloride channel family protein